MTEDATGPEAEISEDATSDSSDSENPSEVESEESAAPEPVDPLEEALTAAAQLKDKLMRMAADFDNYRKRSRREVVDAGKKGRDGLLTDLLPVFDNLERATSHAEKVSEVEPGSESSETSDDADLNGLIDGITLVMKQFRDALSRLGIERVESVGQAFDPALHEAIQHLETHDFPAGCIAAEVQPGYRDGDRLIRAAMVVVAKTPPESVSVESSDGESPES